MESNATNNSTMKAKWDIETNFFNTTNNTMPDNSSSMLLVDFNTTTVNMSMIPESYNHPTHFLVLVTLFKVITFIVGVVGNILVMVVVKKNMNMRNSTNMFLLNLSLADLAVMVFCVPTNLAEMFGKQVWYFGEAMCKLVAFMQFTVVTVSVLNILAISLERYFAICYPLKAQYICTIERAIRSVIGIWIVSVVLNIPYLIMMVQTQTISHLTGELVYYCEMPVLGTLWREVFVVGNVILFFTIPFIILVYIYGRMMHHLLWKKETALMDGSIVTDQSKRLRKQVVSMLIAVVVLFFVCLTPFRVIMIWFVYVKSHTLNQMGSEALFNLVYACRILFLINSAVNPIIYNIFSTKFRMAFKMLLFPKYRQRADSFVTTTNGSLSKPKLCESSSDTTHILSQKIALG